MPVIVGNETYTRLIYDPDDIEPEFLVDGKLVEVDKLAELSDKAVKQGKKLNIEISQRIDPEAKPIKVTFKPLRSKDKTAIEDTVQMEYGAASGTVAPGSMRRLAIKRAVISWDYEVPFTENVLDNLDPGIFEQLYGWVSWGSAPKEQDEATGLPLDDPEPTPNRAARRAAKPKTQKTTAAPASGS